MARRSKTHHSRVANLREANIRKGASKNGSQWAEIPNDGSTITEEQPLPPFVDGIIAQDKPDEVSESETSTDDTDDDSPEIIQAAANQLEIFAANLARAQREAEAAERETRAQNKRPRVYKGDSERTRQRRRHETREMEKKGYQSITKFFKPAGEDKAVIEDVWDSPLIHDKNQAQAIAIEDDEVVEIPSDGETAAAVSNVEVAPILNPEGLMEEEVTLEAWRDFEKLKEARNRLTIITRNKKIGAVVQLHLIAMMGALNLFLSNMSVYTWRKATSLVAQAQGRGEHYARKLRTWILEYLHSDFKELPLAKGRALRCQTLLDEDISMGTRGIWALWMHIISTYYEAIYNARIRFPP
ncbi:hypothetical protein JOM56_007132 [Amanita muscaria]